MRLTHSASAPIDSSGSPISTVAAAVSQASNRESLRSRLLLGLLAVLVAVSISSASFNSVDTLRRYQVTRWIWAGEPQVLTANDPGFGVYGRDGELHAWYGIGQSLVMLPFDVVASAAISAVPLLRTADEDSRRRIRIGMVAVGMSALTCAVGVIAAFELLVSLGFALASATRGAVALLLCTTYLTYTQTVMENGLIMALTLCAAACLVKGVTTRSRPYLVVAGVCMGFNLLVRLTTLLDAGALILFSVLVVVGHERSLSRIRTSLVSLFISIGPSLVCFVALDRLYHFVRFGRVTGTYIALWGEQMRVLDPTLPASFPFTTPFWDGFVGAWISPLRSVLIYDPLLIVSLLVIVFSWRRQSHVTRSYFASMCLLLVAYMSFYATYNDWGGTTFWGNRFLVGPVQAISLLAVPTLSDGRILSSTWFRTLGVRISVLCALVVQISSVVFSVNLEMGRMISAQRFSCILVERWTSIAMWVSGRAIDVDTPYRFTVPNIFPFVVTARIDNGLFVPLMVVWCGVFCSVIVVLRCLLVRRSRSLIS